MVSILLAHTKLVSLNADHECGRPQSEGGRLRRDRPQPTEPLRGARHGDTTMHKSDDPTLQDYDDYIASALRTEGGHLSIGRGGFTLYYARGARLSGYDAGRSRPAALRPACRSSTAGRSPSKTLCASTSAGRWQRSPKSRAHHLITRSLTRCSRMLSCGRSRGLQHSWPRRDGDGRGRGGRPVVTDWRSRERLSAARHGEYGHGNRQDHTQRVARRPVQ